MDNIELKNVREAIINAIPQELFTEGYDVKPGQIYFPPAHEKSLKLYTNLIVGGRGVGKSMWTSALADEQKRTIIRVNVPELENTKVQIGFSAVDRPEDYPSLETIAMLLDSGIKPYEMWQTVILRWLVKETKDTIPVNEWKESIIWVRNNPEKWVKIITNANDILKNKNINGLILFDALDRSSNDWASMDNIVRDLLRIAIRLKSFSNIHLKIFLRKDQYDRDTTDFPDSSKLKSTMAELTWSLEDLHGLLWQYFLNADNGHRDTFHSIYKKVTGHEPVSENNYCSLNDDIKRDNFYLKKLFEELAGPWMGKDIRRGVPYLWSVGHLADGRKQASPRSFLSAIRNAAEDSLSKDNPYPLFYGSIKLGVQNASQIRINELAEDYKWVKHICDPLQRMNVPVEFSEISQRWDEKYPNGPTDIPFAGLPPQFIEKGWEGIKDELIRLGIFEENQDKRINMPDLYRIGFGLGRKGGVPPLTKQ
ncbi:MAG: hypothetical protein LBQ61_05645 [Spirochaetales bacterium]|jgi:hypothetical protein|nr:hypothetical protein [Spirochaetales bacterium]